MRHIANIFLFLIFYGLTTHAVFWMTPAPAKMDAALEAFKEKKDFMSILFVGSSHMTHQIIPEVVDRTLRERGLEHKSYVLGLGGATPHQMNFLLAEAMRQRPANLQIVVMDALPWSYELDTATWRGTWWHSPAQTWDVVQTILHTERPSLDKWALIRGHIGLAFRKNFCIGTGLKISDLFSGRLSRWLDDAYGIPYGDPNKRQARLIRRTLERNGYRRFPQKHGYLAGYLEGDILEPELEFGTYNPPGLQRQVDRIHRRGLKLAYLLSPTTIDHEAIRDLEVEGIIPHLLDFNRPEVYPELFVKKHRFDQTHINHGGAELYSALVAEELADLLAQDPPPELGAEL